MKMNLTLFRKRTLACSKGDAKATNASGFSLMELVIAMAILLVMLAGASRLLMSSLGARTRENQKSDALADAQRALNIMSREISNSGFGLDFNGLVSTDCHPTSPTDPIPAQIRFRSNLNNIDAATLQADEDVTYVYQPAPVSAIVRYDRNTNSRTVLAGDIAELKFYFRTQADVDADAPGAALASATAVKDAVQVRILVKVDLRPIAGQPASQVLLTSDIALRNAPGTVVRY